MKFNRSSGILLHPTSLPGPDGIGDLGPAAYEWVNSLAKMGCGNWQILPLGPTGYGDSPYQCFSAFAGNPYLVSPAMIMNMGLLNYKDFEGRPEFPEDKVDYGTAIPWKLTILDRAFRNYLKQKPAQFESDFSCFQEEQAFWLDDFSLFITIKEKFNNIAWADWPTEFKMRDKKTLKKVREEQTEDILRQKFRQFLFFEQWNALHKFANSKNINIIGDIPIFIAGDSADAWANPELFYLDEQRNPTVVAGVPPDYFSPTGQLWGNPLYNWDAHKKNNYHWWAERFRSLTKMVDIIRLDHFRGFSGYWEVPADKPTAEIGRWAPGPGIHFFDEMKKQLGDLPIIAEDLGEITPDVDELRDRYEFPGMKILQFAFGSPQDPFLPHNYVQNCVAYTGTHDNDTTLGWYRSAPDNERDYCNRYLGTSEEDITWKMIRAIWASVAVVAVAPLQDLFNLGTEARMNFPGKPHGNWTWKMSDETIEEGLINKIRDYNYLFNRLI